MQRIDPNCSVNDLLFCSDKLLGHFLDQTGDFRKVEAASISIARSLKENSSKNFFGGAEGTIRNYCKVLSILFAAVSDYCKLQRITQDESYLAQPREIEKAWYSYCNCKDRLDFVKPYLASVEKIPIIVDLNNFRQMIDSLLGLGQYASPEIAVSKWRCSICNEQIEMCPHVTGGIYDGKICRMLPDCITGIMAVAVVDSPRDLRNRIWPWNFTIDENGQIRFKVRLLTQWDVEDFDD